MYGIRTTQQAETEARDGVLTMNQTNNFTTRIPVPYFNFTTVWDTVDSRYPYFTPVPGTGTFLVR